MTSAPGFWKNHAVRHCHPNEGNQPVSEIVMLHFFKIIADKAK